MHYVHNQTTAVEHHEHHFYGLRDALPTLRGVALFDRLDREPRGSFPVERLVWKRREIENHLCSRATLEAYAQASARESLPGSLFSRAESERRLEVMDKAIQELESALKTLRKGSPRRLDFKVSDEFLTPLFKIYFREPALPNLMAKKAFHELADLVPESELDSEIRDKLDAIVQIAESATPL